MSFTPINIGLGILIKSFLQGSFSLFHYKFYMYSGLAGAGLFYFVQFTKKVKHPKSSGVTSKDKTSHLH